jgi:hypothetical protein
MPRVVQALAIAAVAAFAAGNAFAASQGTLGATSQGTLDITLTIDPLVQISALDDIPLGTYAGAGDMTGADDLCVYSNNGGYDITATGNGTGQAFTLTGTSSATVPYTVEWATSAGAGSGTALTTGVPLAGQSGTSARPIAAASRTRRSSSPSATPISLLRPPTATPGCSRSWWPRSKPRRLLEYRAQPLIARPPAAGATRFAASASVGGRAVGGCWPVPRRRQPRARPQPVRAAPRA